MYPGVFFWLHDNYFLEDSVFPNNHRKQSMDLKQISIPAYFFTLYEIKSEFGHQFSFWKKLMI